MLVTGATGGSGHGGHRPAGQAGHPDRALTRKEEGVRGRLRQLGAREVRPPPAGTGDRPLLKERWGGVVDTIGGESLGTLLKATCAGGVVAACGMTAGNQFSSSVYPFILRGVTRPASIPARPPRPGAFASGTTWPPTGTWTWSGSARVTLDGVAGSVRELLAGTHVGRTVVKIG